MPDEEPRVLSLLSHELRGPIGVVRGYLRLLVQSSSELSDHSRETVAAALRAADRLADVLDEASLLTHLRMGKISLDPKKAPVTSIVEAAIQTAALPGGVRAELEPLPPLHLDADARHLSKALATLFTLVARSHPHSRVVHIGTVTAQIGGKPALRLHVRPQTLLEAEMVEADLNIGRGGYGLAVPIAAAIVEGHGGVVRELSDGERSAGVVVTLPVR
jgi:signal transduction histidine kinase